MTTIGQDEAAQAMAERDPLPQEVTYHVWTADEPAAGLQGERAEVRMAAVPEDDGEAHEILCATFAHLWGEDERHVRVMREAPPGRTPETVLRAMVSAYARAATDAEADVLRLAPHTASTAIQSRMFKAQEAEANMRAAAATYLAEGEILPWLHTATDYQQRLSGARDLNAPPLDEP